MSLLVLVFDTITILGVAAFITFLWFGSQSNNLWRTIALKGWMTKSVTLASVLLRTALSLQTGIAVPMIASIALERSRIRLSSLASVSTMRNSGSTFLPLLEHLYQAVHLPTARRGKASLVFLLAACLFAITLLLQFTSTLLLSDISTGLVSSSRIFAGSRWSLAGSTFSSGWEARSRSYPVFAEYAETPSDSDNFSDTGLSLKALLPISDRQLLQSIHTFEGSAAVIDSRVICVQPEISEFQVEKPSAELLPIATGVVSIPSGFLPDSLIAKVSSTASVKFACRLAYGIVSADNNFHESNWNISLCQLSSPSLYLLSEWLEASDDDNVEDSRRNGGFWLSPKGKSFSSSYLAVNYSGIKPSIYDEIDYENTPKDILSYFTDVFNSSKPGLQFSPRMEWLDIYRSGAGYGPNSSMISLSLCLPAFGVANAVISAYSFHNRTEPWYTANPELGSFDFTRIRNQLGVSNPVAASSRGILSMPRPTFNLSKYGYGYPSGNDIGMGTQVTSSQDGTIQFTRIQNLNSSTYAAFEIACLAQEILHSGGTIAQAVQSMLWSIVTTQYYRYLFGEMPEAGLKEGESSGYNRTTFIAVQIPGGNGAFASGHAGASWPYLTVMLLLGCHCSAIIVCCIWFLKGAYSSVHTWSILTWMQEPRSQLSGTHGRISLKSVHPLQIAILRIASPQVIRM